MSKERVQELEGEVTELKKMIDRIYHQAITSSKRMVTYEWLTSEYPQWETRKKPWRQHYE